MQGSLLLFQDALFNATPKRNGGWCVLATISRGMCESGGDTQQAIRRFGQVGPVSIFAKKTPAAPD